MPRILAGKPAPVAAELADGVTLRIATVLLSETKTAYLDKSRGGLDIGNKFWPPLAPATLMVRQLKAEGSKKRPLIWEAYRQLAMGKKPSSAVDILRDTGRLFASLSQAIAPGRLSVGTNVKYAKYHQSPLPRKLKMNGQPKLPRRQIFWDWDKIPTQTWGRMLSAAVKCLVANLGRALPVIARRP